MSGHPFPELTLDNARGTKQNVRVLRSLLCLLLTLLAAAAHEQPADSDFLVRIWRSEEGLPGNVVRSVGQTADGFLWVATAEGLARFDGIEFKTIPIAGSHHARELQFFRVFTPGDGSVWVSTYENGLFRLREDGLEQVFASKEDQPERALITNLFIHRNSVYIHHGDRVRRLDGNRARTITSPPPELAEAVTSARRRQRERGRTDDKLTPERLVDSVGGIWRIENKSLTYRPPDDAPESPPVPELEGRAVVSDMLEDREGNLWLASPVRGLVRIRHRRVTYLPTEEGLYQNTILTAHRASDGTWWLANRNGGVDRIHDGELTFTQLFTSVMRVVSCIFEDSSGRLWFGTRNGSIFIWDTGVMDFEARFTRTPEISKVKDIVEDDEGRLWFGGIQGLCRTEGTTVENFSEHPALAGARFSTLALDSRGHLFAGTMDGSVFRFDGTDFTPVGRPGALGGSRISTLLPVSPGELWASTIGSGLFLWKGGRWHQFDRDDGIPDERLTTLTLVGEDDFWLGSLGGILHTSRAELLRHREGTGRIPRWLRLDRSDGMITRECIGGAQPGVFRDDDGKLWFPTTSGLAGVDPRALRINSVPPAIYFNAVDVDGVPRHGNSGPIRTDPGRVRLGFHFTGVSLSAPEKVRYRARLVGLDDELRLIGDQRNVNYAAVPPGRYTFELHAINGDGVATASPAMISVEVPPHLWETAWFRSISLITALVVAIGIGWLIARRRMKRNLEALRVRNALDTERSRISRDLHDDLGADLTELAILSGLAEEKPDYSSLRESLSRLSLKTKRVIAALDEIVWATNPTADSLRSLIEYLAAFAREFLEAVHVPLETDIERNIPDVMIGPRRRHNVLLATREAINNAVKHAEPSVIRLRIAIEDDHLVITIRDDGNGFVVEYAAAGDGLSNLRKRMTDCGGDCRFESVRGKGTTVTLTLPLPT